MWNNECQEKDTEKEEIRGDSMGFNRAIKDMARGTSKHTWIGLSLAPTLKMFHNVTYGTVPLEKF